MMIAIAISSNLQGAATLIGDPPSMLLAGYAKMNFGDFFFYQGKPGIFFAVQLGALASLVVLYLLFRRHREKTAIICIENITSWVPTVMLVALIVLLALSSFFDTGFSYAAGIICMIIGALGLIWAKVFNKVKIIPSIKKLDWETTFFLMGVFVLVGSLTANGWIDRIAAFFTSSIGDNLFLGYTFLVLVAMIVSAFVDNVPFLAAMLPVAIAMGKDLNIDPTLFLFGLLIGASLGGNITPIGASANIVACSLLRKEGYHVGFGQFAKIGVPFTLVAVAAAYLFVWFIWT
jgi:Na+/H+ antiporter NhaD/arsenite permease-like protein